MILKWRRKEELFHFKFKNVESLPFNSGHSLSKKKTPIIQQKTKEEIVRKTEKQKIERLR